MSSRNQPAVPSQALPAPTPQVPLGPTCGLIVVHVDSLQLQVTVPVVCARGVDAVLVTDHLPELEGQRWQEARWVRGWQRPPPAPASIFWAQDPPTTSLAATCPPAR